MSGLKREAAALDRAAALLAQFEAPYAKPRAARMRGERASPPPPFKTRWGHLPPLKRTVNVAVPWDRVRRVVADNRPDPYGTEWQRKGLEIVLVVPALRSLLARRSGRLVKHADDSWSFAGHCYPQADQPGGFGCLWWSQQKPYWVAWDGLRREQSAVADMAYSILNAAQGYADPSLGVQQDWYDQSGRRTLSARVMPPPEGEPKPL